MISNRYQKQAGHELYQAQAQVGLVAEAVLNQTLEFQMCFAGEHLK